MTPTLWQLYLDLQTTLAYEASAGIVNSSKKQVDHISGVSLEMSLIIGPGDVDECVAVKNKMSGRLYALTAHKPEATLIAASGVAEGIVGDIHNMPFGARSFDFLYAANVLEHTFAPYIALMECRRVLKNEGKAVFVMPEFDGPDGGVGTFHLHCLDYRVWKELLRKTGHHIEQELIVKGDEAPFNYYHFHCRAGDLPYPHSEVLEKLISLKG